MLHFLGFLFILIIAILIIGLSIIFSIIRGLFGFGRKKPSARNFQGGYTFYGDNRQSSSRTSTTWMPCSASRSRSRLNFLRSDARLSEP